jgi:hypothetical protein
MKYTSVSNLGLQPNPAVVASYYTTADGQSDTGAWIFCLIVQPFDLSKIRSYAVILADQMGLGILPNGTKLVVHVGNRALDVRMATIAC